MLGGGGVLLDSDMATGKPKSLVASMLKRLSLISRLLKLSQLDGGLKDCLFFLNKRRFLYFSLAWWVDTKKYSNLKQYPP